MSSLKPEFCRPEAYELFRRQLDDLERTDNLVTAAVAISMHALDDVKPQQIMDRIDELARRVKLRVRSGSESAVLAHLHQVLFVDEGFRGSSSNYYSCLNSYLPAVLEAREGIPITLTLIYKAVAERVGVSVDGINAPGHFLAQVNTSGTPMIVDPFSAGRVLTGEEAIDWVGRITGYSFGVDDEVLVPATHRQWLQRLLRNLQGIFSRDSHLDDLAAMNEFMHLLRATNCDENAAGDGGTSLEAGDCDR